MFPVSQLFALSLNFLSTYWHEAKIALKNWWNLLDSCVPPARPISESASSKESDEWI